MYKFDLAKASVLTSYAKITGWPTYIIKNHGTTPLKYKKYKKT